MTTPHWVFLPDGIDPLFDMKLIESLRNTAEFCQEAGKVPVLTIAIHPTSPTLTYVPHPSLTKATLVELLESTLADIQERQK